MSSIYATEDGRVSVERISLYLTPPGDRHGTRFAGDGVHYVVRTLGSVTGRIPERPGDDFDEICRAQGLVPVAGIPRSRSLWRQWATARLAELEEAARADTCYGPLRSGTVKPARWLGGEEMKRLGTAIGGLAAAAALAAGCSTAATTTGHAPSATPSKPPAVTQTYSFDPSKVTGSGSCDVSLSSDLNGQDYLTASVDLTNGNSLQGTATVTVSWPLQGFSPLSKSKTVTIAANGGTADVELHIAANQSQVSEFQDEQLSSAGQAPGGPCTYNILANP